MTITRKPFYLMRHAQSTDNEQGLISGAGSDPHLSALGRAQAEEARQVYLKLGTLPEKIIVSGLVRTHQTAHLVVGHTDFIIDPNLNERHLGDLDGKISEAEQITRKTLPGEESSADHRARVLKALNQHLTRDTLPLFICHGGTVRRVMELTGIRHEQRIGNAEIFYLAPGTSGWRAIKAGESS